MLVHQRVYGLFIITYEPQNDFFWTIPHSGNASYAGNLMAPARNIGAEYMVTQKWCRNQWTHQNWCVFLHRILWHHFGGFRILSSSVFHRHPMTISTCSESPGNLAILRRTAFLPHPGGKEADEGKMLKLCSIISLNGIFRNLNWIPIESLAIYQKSSGFPPLVQWLSHSNANVWGGFPALCLFTYYISSYDPCRSHLRIRHL